MLADEYLVIILSLLCFGSGRRNSYRDFAAGKLKAGIVKDQFSYIATPDELKENEYNLNIPRYTDTFVEEEEVDIAKVQTETEVLEKELAAAQNEMKKYLTELGA